MRRGFCLAFRAAALPLVAALLALMLGDAASAQSPLVFGIQPAATVGAGAGGYFTYTLEPGTSASGEAAVINSGGEPVNLHVYAADGVTAINGSTAFAGANEERSGVRSWLSTSVSALVLAPGERARLPFTVSVPSGAAPGDHVAGWVVEAPPKAGASGAVAATIVERAGVAVVVHVPGPAVEQLALDSICLNQETGSNYFEVGVRNEGNVLTRGSGSLTLALPNGKTVFERAADLGSVLPRDATLLRLDAPFDPGPGEYVAVLALKQPDGQEVQVRADIVIGERKVNGCVAVAGEGLEGQRGTFLGAPGGATPWLILGALVAVFLVLLGLRAAVSWRRQSGGGGEP